MKTLETSLPDTNATMPLLLVVKHAQLRSVVRKILIGKGFILFEAADTRTALMALRILGNGIALMITDEDLSETSGEELAARVKRTYPSLPLLIMASVATGRDYAGNADLLVSKPFAPTKLIKAVRRLLAGPAQ